MRLCETARLAMSRTSRFATAVLVFAGVACASAACASKNAQAIELPDLHLFSPSGGAVSISADGRWLAVEGAGDVRVGMMGKRSAKTSIGEGIAPQWSPNSTKLAFYSTRSGNRQLWVWHIDDAKASQVTRLMGGLDPDPTTRIAGVVNDAFRFSWSPDSKFIVFPSRVPVAGAKSTRAESGFESHYDEPAEGKPLVLTNSTPVSLTMSGLLGESVLSAGVPEVKEGKTWSYRPAQPGETLFNQLFIVDIETGDTDQLTHGARSAFHPDWSKDGSTIVFSTVDGSLLDTQVATSEIVLIDPVLKRERVLVSDRRIKYQPSWPRDQSKIAFLSLPNLFGWPKIDLVTAANGVSADSTPTLDRYIIEFQWAETVTGIIVRYKDGVSWRLGLINLETGTFNPLTPYSETPYITDSFDQSDDGTTVWRQLDPKEFGAVQRTSSVRDARTETVMSLQDNLKDYAVGRVEIVSWRNGRGDSREGTVLFPPDFQVDRTYPLIVDAYPGVSGAYWSNPMGGNFAWAALGYVVFRPSPRAPHVWMNPWKSKESSHAGRGPEGWELALDDVTSGVDALIERGIVDSDRMCLFGHSNGGGVVTHLIGQTDRFQCAVIVAPAMTNWLRLAFNVENDGWMRRLAGGKGLEEAVDDYLALSPVFRLKSVETPVLLAAGDNDHNFLLNAIEIYSRLRILRKKVTLLRYPNQGHIFSGEALDDFWNRKLAFFDKHLRTQTQEN